MVHGILPVLPSALIELALIDLAKAERSRHYKIYMNGWHSPGYNGCEVCLAGAVMAFSLGVDRDRFASPSMRGIHPTDKAALIALNEFRRGKVECGLNFLRRKLPLGAPLHLYVVGDRVISDYSGTSASRRAFKRDMRRLIHDFRAVGL